MSTEQIPIIKCTACKRNFWVPTTWLQHKAQFRCDGNGAIVKLPPAEAEARAWATLKEIHAEEHHAFGQLGPTFREGIELTAPTVIGKKAK
jgi:hypothetical protein